MLDALDIVSIHQLLGSYGHLLDRRDWQRFAALFAADASIDYQGTTGRTVCHGRHEIVEWFQGGNHPAAHHVTNIFVDESAEPDGLVEVHAKFIAPYSRDGHDPKRLYGGDYRDIVVKRHDRWVFASKECIPRWNLSLLIDDNAPEHRRTY